VVEVERDYNRTALCVPTQHPLNVTGMGLPSSPDVVLALEVRDLAVVPGVGDAAVLHVNTAGLGVTAWAADLRRVQPAEVPVAAEVGATLRALVPAVRRLLAQSDRAGIVVARRRQVAAFSAEARQRWRRQALAAGDDTVVHPEWIAHVAGEVVRDHRPVLANGSLH